MPPPSWLEALEPRAPDVVAVWRAIDDGPMSFRRQVRRRSGPGSAAGVLAQQEAVADALAAALDACSEELLRAPGGEEDWNVAHANVHRYTPHNRSAPPCRCTDTKRNIIATNSKRSRTWPRFGG